MRTDGGAHFAGSDYAPTRCKYWRRRSSNQGRANDADLPVAPSETHRPLVVAGRIAVDPTPPPASRSQPAASVSVPDPRCYATRRRRGCWQDVLTDDNS